MIPAAARARFVQAIDAELASLEQFRELLQREQALLIDGDTDGLMSLTPKKSALHQQLQRQHDALAMLLGQHGITPSAEAIQQLCAGLPDVLARWDSILDLGAEVKALNEINGKLITERMQNNQAALSVLLSAADQPSLYDAGGSARPSGRGRHLGSA
ncbi:MAG: flagellar protein FlgN [Pseudazoarcus pumilus]|nr:flagellar protein FlgN [Pseudazoarcus pumilus]